MRKIFIFVLLCSVAFAENPYRVFNNFNAGELSPLLSAREDLAKYQSGCSIMENMIPLPQGGAIKRPGTKYIAEVKTSSLATRILPFEFSTSQSYIIEVGNQYMRFFTDSAAINTGNGTETALASIVAHWLLNEGSGTTAENAANPGTYDGTASVDASALNAAGKVGTGCFDLDEQYTVEIADAAAFSFTNNTDDSAFSIVCWAYVTQQSDIQNVLSKWRTDNLAREWRLSLTNDRKLQLHLADTSLDLTGSRIAHWKLNENAADKNVLDDDATSHDGLTQTSNTEDLTETGKVNAAINFGKVGNDAVVITNDHIELSFGDGTNDSTMSISAWAYVTDQATTQTILSKYDVTSGTEAREWRLFINSDEKLLFVMYDESTNAWQGIEADAALTTGWHHIVLTYNGVGGNSAANGLTIYVDNVAVAVTRPTGGTYTAMENTATTVKIGAIENAAGNLSSYFKDKLDNIVLFNAELAAAQVSPLWNGGDGTEALTSINPTAYAITDAAVSIGWRFFTATYSAPADSTAAADGIILYVDGAAVDSTATNDATYTAMQGAGEAIRIGSQNNSADSADEKFWGDKIDEVSVYSDVLTPAEIVTLYDETPYEIETPYLTADLFEIKYEQSADVLYLTHPDYETRKLSRIANATWTIATIDIQNGSFRTQNSDVADFIAASATTGTVTLTATGHTPFALGSASGHEPSGTTTTSKSQTGALFRLSHPLDTLAFADTLEDDYAADQTEGVSWMSCGTLYEGTEWTFITGGTWLGTVEVQRNYTIGAAHGASNWETVLPFKGVTTARNVSTSGTEDDGDADYRVIFIDDTSGIIEAYFTTDQTEHVGIVKITAVTDGSSATATVLTTLASTDATHKWSEGAWSNYRGWPQTVAFFEDRLCFGGNTSQPDTIWASVTGDYENFTEGAEDDDALNFTLSSRQVNVIEWLVGKDKLLIGTSGAEWTLEGGADEPLTPSNVIAKQHSTYGSANLQANLANESVLFFQRGKEKMRELAYNWELDSYIAPDMTILANLVTDSGIDDTAFQKTPDSILWCVRNDGELPIFSYERGENITAWSRMVTQTNLAGTLADSDFESVARIHGSPEDEVWVVVERVMAGVNSGNPVRYIEQFQGRDFGSDADDAFYVDCGVTYDSTESSAMTGLDHLEGQTVYVLADGVVFDTAVVSGGGITLKSGGTTTTAFTVQMGLGYEINMRTMPLSWIGGETIQGRIKRISEVVANWYVSGDFSLGRDVDTLGTFSIDGQTTSQDRMTFPPGYDRNGYVYIYQQSPEPLTLLGVATEFQVQ